MPAQTKNSSFAKRLGARVSAANAEFLGKPVDTGNRRLPPNIRGGIARLSTMYTKEQLEDGGKTPKGETFFRASAIVEGVMLSNCTLVPEFKGENIKGMVTQVMIPLCDIPAKGKSKAVSFSENYKKMRDLIMSLGIDECKETPYTDPTGEKTEAYWFSAMDMLVERTKQKPIYVEFSTRGWTPEPTPEQPHPAEMVIEKWHGKVNFERNGQSPTAMVEHPAPFSSPPTPDDIDSFEPTSSPTPEPEANPDLVQQLVEIAMNDPEGATAEGAEACFTLERMAFANGWTEAHTENAANWEEVGKMALESPPATAPAPSTPTVPGSTKAVAVGTKHMFQRRTKEGSKLKDSKGKEFPPVEVEVVTMSPDATTCTVRTVKDGKDVVDIRTKKPLEVKLEWLD